MKVVALLVAVLLLMVFGAVVAIAVGIAVKLIVAMFRASPPAPASPPTYVSDWDDGDEIAARRHLHET